MIYFIVSCLAAFLSASASSVSGRYVPEWNRHPDNNKHHRRDLQSSVNRVQGHAYECLDNDLEKSLSGDHRDYKPGTIIRICVKPEIPTANRGVVMRSVDDFILRGEASSLTQKVIEGKREKYSALSLCVGGNLVCAFKVRLNEELFWGEGEDTLITGTGLLTMEFKDPSFALNGVAATEIGVKLEIPVFSVTPPPGVVLGGGETDCNWWCQTPFWFRICLISMAVLIICCICSLCATSCGVIKELREEDKERKQER